MGGLDMGQIVDGFNGWYHMFFAAQVSSLSPAQFSMSKNFSYYVILTFLSDIDKLLW